MRRPPLPAPTTRQHLAASLDHIEGNEPANATLPRYLEAAAAWLEDANGFYANIGEVRDVDGRSFPGMRRWQP